MDESATYQGWSPIAIECKRHLNRVLVRNALNPSGPLHRRDHEAISQRLTGVLPRRFAHLLADRQRSLIARTVGDRYGASNRELAALVDLDLGSLGYSVGP